MDVKFNPKIAGLHFPSKVKCSGKPYLQPCLVMANKALERYEKYTRYGFEL